MRPGPRAWINLANGSTLAGLAVARAHREHSQEQLNMPAPVPEPAAVSPWAIVTDDLPGLNGHNPESS